MVVDYRCSAEPKSAIDQIRTQDRSPGTVGGIVYGRTSVTMEPTMARVVRPHLDGEPLARVVVAIHFLGTSMRPGGIRPVCMGIPAPIAENYRLRISTRSVGWWWLVCFCQTSRQ